MGNKILTLFEIEFKKIQKIYFALLSVLVVGNIGILAYSLYLSILEMEDTLGYKGGISLLKNIRGIKAFPIYDMIILIYQLSLFIFLGALIWCLYYGLAIWYKDFSNKTKPIYTLFMLPENKFIIFISKLITMVALTYGVIFVQFMCWIIGGIIIKSLSGASFAYMINTINTMPFILRMSIIPRISRLDFLMFYILGPILAMTVLFTGVMMQKSVKKIGGVLGGMYVISIIMVYGSTTALNNSYTDVLMKTHTMFYSIVFIASMAVSYNILTKQIHE